MEICWGIISQSYATVLMLFNPKTGNNDLQSCDLKLVVQRAPTILDLHVWVPSAQAIYPIKYQEKLGAYTIRGLEVPADLFSVDDEKVSSALGYTAHLVCMLAKYLQVPLRYQLIYNASRCVACLYWLRLAFKWFDWLKYDSFVLGISAIRKSYLLRASKNFYGMEKNTAQHNR